MQAPIVFGNNQQSGLEPLGGASPIAINVITDKTGAVMQRPGIKLATGIISSSAIDGDGVIGLYETEGRKLYAVGDAGPGEGRSIYRIDGGGKLELSNSIDTYLMGSTRPVFAETEMLLVIAGGSDMQKVELATDLSSRLGGSPPLASHVSAIASRLVANDAVTDKSTVRYSSVANGNTSYAGHEQWSQGIGTAGFFRAEARPDSVVALADNANELFAFGGTSVQVFSPDPTFVFAPSATREFGLGAAYSVVKSDAVYYWFDERRRFVKSDARSYEIISDPIKRTLDDMATVSDCFGYRVQVGPVDAIVWTFPSDGRTFAYQQGVGWSEWLGWDDSVANWRPFPVLCHCYTRDGKNLVGLDGWVGQFDLDTFTDASTDTLSDRVMASVTTGFINHGTDALKHCKRLYLRIKRGQSTGTTAPVGFLYYRDSLGAWSSPISVSFGVNSDLETVVRIDSLGSYRTRQWKFEFGNNVAMVLAGVTEEFDVLGV
jgi:hypothetical protein